MENYISKNRKVLTQMLFDVLDLVEAKDLVQRKRFKMELLTYISVLHRIVDIHNLLDSDRLMSQYKFSQKLFTLCDRYKDKGLDSKLKDNPLDFIRGLQSKMLETCEDGFYWELKEAEKKDAFSKAFDKIQEEKTSRLEQLKSEAFNKLGKTNIVKDFI